MKKTFKSRFLRLTMWFGCLFVALFLFRLIYGYTAVETNALADLQRGDFFSSIENVRKNYASEKMLKPNAAPPAAAPVAANMSSNQKFEKTASLKTKSTQFSVDEQAIKAKTTAYNAVIQYEQNLGRAGSRELHLLIGVNPSAFDIFYAELQKIGELRAIEVVKVDKTNEYRQLNAQRISIEKNLQSLSELKARGGEISDFIKLNEKILSMEEKLQELGVELGNFSSENEFCTVKLSMYEGAAERSIGFTHRLKVAFEWAIKYFAFMVFTLLFLALAIFILLLIVDKLKVITAVKHKFAE